MTTKTARWLMALALLGVDIAFVFSQPAWAKPALRSGYVAGWTLIKRLGLDPCHSCEIPDRFK